MEDDFEFPAAGYDDIGMEDDSGIPVEDPTPKVGEEKEIGENGLRKKILKEGEGWETPNSGDEVEVHYVGTLMNGEQFDSSIDQDKPFNFKLGQGHVIKGWDEGIKTMKKGEKALFVIPPALAYGESGSPPMIPPNSILQFEVELLSWISINDITKDGGILKKVLKQGEGWQKPRDLDEVCVKYEVLLEDGTIVSSKDGAEFTVKDGHLCPALSEAVKTMKKEERSLLTVKPEYGFGENGWKSIGNECAVPANATVQINLELVSWKRVSDINNDKKILKKVLKEGEGYEHPNDCATVKVKLIGKLLDGTVFSRQGHDKESPFEFKVDEDEVIEGIDRAVKTMNKGEVALLTIQPEFAFGPSESPQELAAIPGNSVVYYDIEMVSFVNEKESWKLSEEEKIPAAGKKKEEGNRWFRAGKYKRASKRYEKAVSFIDYESSFSDEEKEQAKALKITCNLNNVACKLRLKEYKEAKNLCNKVLETDFNNVKALYRRAQANIFLVELELAELDVKKVLELNPDNRDVKSLYKLWKEKVREYNRKDAQFYSSIFAKMKTLEQAESTDTPARRGGVQMAIERLKRVCLPWLTRKDLQIEALERKERACSNPARAFGIWLISFLAILVAVYWSVLKKY